VRFVISNTNLKCTIDAFSCAGSTRDNNEDAIVHDAAHGLAVLADGMGGHNAGEVASQRTVEGVIKRLQDYLGKHVGVPTIDEAREQLKKVIADINFALFDEANSIPAYAGMGCTLVVVWLVRVQALIANIGDSRCYLLRNRKLIQVTRDHSFVQFQMDNELISEAEVQGGNVKNYLLRSVGTAKKVSADFFVLDLELGDVLLAVSDGMTEALNYDALQDRVLEAIDSPSPAKMLASMAIESGSRDNVSIQCIFFGHDELAKY